MRIKTAIVSLTIMGGKPKPPNIKRHNHLYQAEEDLISQMSIIAFLVKNNPCRAKRLIMWNAGHTVNRIILALN